nr:hypothetical protein [Tanacetum cinerariifolium]
MDRFWNGSNGSGTNNYGNKVSGIIQKIIRRCGSGFDGGKRKHRFIEGNMTRNDDFIGVKIKATIAKMIGSMSHKYGRNGWVIPTGSSVSEGVTAAGGLLSTSRGLLSTAGGSPCTWTFTAANSVYNRGSTAASGFFPWFGHLGQSPNMPFHSSQLFASGSQGSGQATLLPNAFNTTTLQ